LKSNKRGKKEIIEKDFLNLEKEDNMLFQVRHDDRVVMPKFDEDILLITLFHLSKGDKKDMQIETTEEDIVRYCHDMRNLYPDVFGCFEFEQNGQGLKCNFVRNFISRLAMNCQRLSVFGVVAGDGKLILRVSPVSGVYAKFYLSNFGDCNMKQSHKINIQNAAQYITDNTVNCKFKYPRKL
jgi:hypothetical protein